MILRQIVWTVLRGISDVKGRWQSLGGEDIPASFQSCSTLEKLVLSKPWILLVVSL